MDRMDNLVAYFHLFASLARWKGTLTINGQEVKCGTGRKRIELPCGTVHTSREQEGLVVVRMHGIPMFTQQTNY